MATPGEKTMLHKVELSVACNDLRDMDTFSKSDPICVLYRKEFGQANWVEHGRTEIIWNNLNPKFVKKFCVDHHFEEKQHLKFEMYDVDDEKGNLSKQDFLGEMESTLGHLVCSMTYTTALKDKENPSKNCGTITVICEEQNPACKEIVTLHFSAKNLDNTCKIGKSSPYLEICKEHEDGSFIPVHRTPHVKSCLSPNWNPLELTAMELCNGQYDRNLLLRVYHWKNGGDPLIGETTTTLRNLTRGHGPTNNSKLINKQKKEKQREKYQHSGMLILESISMDSRFQFIDYLQSGCEMKVSVAIDFTKSNGDPRDPSSLHHTSPGSPPNQYARAVEAVIDILQDYDSDKLIPAFGFGAIPAGQTEGSNIFPLNGNVNHPECAGAAGVLEAYYDTLSNVTLHGPTCFAPTIKYVADQAASGRDDGTEYNILLILTDGIIDDMPATKQCIIRASKLPLSIIIVGIGNEDFEPMRVLDGDHSRLSYKKETAIRDIVQFVAFRDFDPRSLSSEVNGKMLLAKEVLEEVPGQVESYMRLRNIRPARFKNRPASTLV